jgi:Flp pilus assembly pilin Flp
MTMWKFLFDESGSTATEYSLILGLISVAVLAAGSALGGVISAAFNAINAQFFAVIP